MPETINGIPTLVFIWGGAIILLAIVFTVIGIKKNQNNNREQENFMAKHPDASKIFEIVKGVISAGGVEIHSVDGEKPLRFVEGTQHGILIVPGEHRIEVEASHSRPGVIYQSVTKSTGTIEKRITVEAHSVYELSYDRKEGTFSFDKKSLTPDK